MTRRIAAIDVGTNSVLLSIVEPKDGELPVILERATVTRLGQGVDDSRRLHPDASARTLACLEDYRKLLDAENVGAVAAVGTSALRDVANAAPFLAQAEALLGCPLEVISGQREAELTFSGALNGIDESGLVFVFDIGGGSTELVWGRVDASGSAQLANVERATSLELGSVRLHERFRLGDPVEPTRLEALRAHVRATLNAYLPRPAVLGASAVVGVAGTVTTLVALSLGLPNYDATLVHGARRSTAELREMASRLASMTLEQRLQLPGLGRGRADVIVSGAWLCCELLDWLEAPSLRASDRGVRYGLLQELARAIAPR